MRRTPYGLTWERPCTWFGANRFSSPALPAVPLAAYAQLTHLTIMSLLRVCQQAVSKQAVGRAALTSSMAYSTQIKPDATIPQTTGQDKEIAEAPQREMLTADIVSGAPSEYQITFRRLTREANCCCRGAASPRCPYLPAHPQYDAERVRQVQPLED